MLEHHPAAPTSLVNAGTQLPNTKIDQLSIGMMLLQTGTALLEVGTTHEDPTQETTQRCKGKLNGKVISKLLNRYALIYHYINPNH